MDQFQSDAEYFARRSNEERAAAERATHPRARQSHIDLADRFAEAARAIAEVSTLWEADIGQERPVAVSARQPEFRILP
ncbi:MAG TPA: hypothetical protein VFU20_06865 [Sphingomicrobium sp.]|nr:hypothetical protein [Sphingomicrobium sp.]